MGNRLKKYFGRDFGIFCILSTVFWLNFYLQNIGVSIAFTRNYLDDLLALPIILWLCRTAMRLFIQNPKFELNYLMTSSVFVLVSILFEVVLPKHYAHLTGDIVDVFCYGFGVVFYQLVMEESV